MTHSKRTKLEKAGFKVGTVKEFLSLSDEDVALIDLKIRLMQMLKTVRQSKGLTQLQLAKRIGSSQSRVAKMEASVGDISLDLICKALFALGVTPKELGQTVGSKKAA